MPITIYQQQWRDQQEPGRYPFADTASLQSDSGLDFGTSTLLDATLHPVGGAERMYLSSVVIDDEQVTFYIGTVVEPQLCSAVFDPLDPPDNLSLLDQYGRAAGLLVSDSLRLSLFQSWDRGTHAFAPADSEFVASCCIPTPEIGVRGFILETGEIFYGDVWLVGDNGIVVREDPDETIPGGHIIRMDVVGDPLFRRRLCSTLDLFVTPPFLKTINGLSGNQYGEFPITVGRNLTTGNILRIIPTAEGLRFEAVGQEN